MPLQDDFIVEINYVQVCIFLVLLLVTAYPTKWLLDLL